MSWSFFQKIHKVKACFVFKKVCKIKTLARKALNQMKLCLGEAEGIEFKEK